MNKLSIFLVFTLFFCSNRKEKPLLDNNNFIEVNFLQKGIKFPISNPCGLIISDGNRKDRHHKIIKEVEIIKKFNEYYSELTVDKEQKSLDLDFSFSKLSDLQQKIYTAKNEYD
jgi:hypothetical protein